MNFGAGSLASIIVALSVNGPASVWALVLIDFFRPIMFPTIFALSMKNLGPLTKRGSSLQVMRFSAAQFFPLSWGASPMPPTFAPPLSSLSFATFTFSISP
jgi:MFS transporter, FHS family, L-fucose permease